MERIMARWGGMERCHATGRGLYHDLSKRQRQARELEEVEDKSSRRRREVKALLHPVIPGTKAASTTTCWASIPAN
jgi:hypothetical protein